jgi:peptidyl-prolyl cis-trans isomerase SurA
VGAVIEKGEDIIKQIRSGLSFEDAAKAFSETDSAVNNGDLGFFTLDELTPALKEVVQELREGEVSHPLRTPAGIQIVQLVGKEEGPAKSLEAARAEIHQKLFQSVVDEKYQEWLKRLKEKAYIKIML